MDRRWIAGIAGVMTVALTCAAIALFHEPAERWSDPATWNGSIPVAGSHVVIPAGKSIILDVTPPKLASVTIAGRLIVADRDVRLETGEIDVRGELRFGDSRHPFVHHALIVLDSTQPGAGVIRVEQAGRVEMWGVRKRTWTQLAETILPGDRVLTLTDDPQWQSGDRIVIAPSGFSASEAEEETLESADGSNLTLVHPVHFRHWGTIADGVDERAEVGLLTHTIVVTSEASGATRSIGGQVLVTSGRFVASGVEFSYLGALGKLGEYPIHFHLANDESGSTVSSSSIVHSFNRCVAIHGTNGVTVQENVAFDSIGHCIFLEDGVETNNTITGNLVLLARAAKTGEAILDSDLQPADFWITNPANSVTGNVAAGSDGNGFWYNLSPHPTGPSATPAIWPRRTALGAFDGNVAHSNENDGLFVDILHNPPGVTEAPNYDPAVQAAFHAFTAYKNRRRGAWLRGTDLRVTNATIADNSIGLTFAGGNDVLQDSLVVGTTQNDTGPPKPFESHFPIRGFEFYDGPVGVERTTFRNFVPSQSREASALSFLRFSPFFTDPTNYVRAVAFENAKPVYFEPKAAALDRLGGDGYRGTVFRDLDGSVAGAAGEAVVIDTPLLRAPDCTLQRTWNAAVCSGSFGSLFVVAVDAGRTKPGPVRVIGPGGSELLRGNPTPSTDAIFQTNVQAGATYAITFARGFPAHLRLGLHDFSDGDRIAIQLPGEPRALVSQSGVAALRNGSTMTLFVRIGPSGEAVIDL